MSETHFREEKTRDVQNDGLSLNVPQLFSRVFVQAVLEVARQSQGTLVLVFGIG